MSRRAPNLNGVSDSNKTAIEITKGRQKAMNEDMKLAKAYRRLPEFCVHFTYHQFLGKVRAIAKAQGRDVSDVATQFVDHWAVERTRWEKHKGAAKKTVRVRELPDGRKVFYGPPRPSR